MNEICGLYQAANELGEQNTHVVSTDEMTGIQALEHKYPDKLPLPNSTAKMEFEYIRHGTTSLIVFFDIAGGFLCSPYLNKTRTEEDFCHALEEVISTDPNGTWVFVCDGLNIHKSETLVQFIAQACGLEDGLGEKGKSGILKNKASREAFLLIEQYNLTAHPFKWTYAGRSFNCLIHHYLRNAVLGFYPYYDVNIYHFNQFWKEPTIWRRSVVCCAGNDRQSIFSLFDINRIKIHCFKQKILI